MRARLAQLCDAGRPPSLARHTRATDAGDQCAACSSPIGGDERPWTCPTSATHRVHRACLEKAIRAARDADRIQPRGSHYSQPRAQPSERPLERHRV